MESVTDMNQFSYQAGTFAKYTKTNYLLKQGISLISGLSVVGGQLLLAPVNASTDTLIIPDTITSLGKPGTVEPSFQKIPKSSPRIVPNRSAANKPVLSTPSVKPTTPKIDPKPSVPNLTRGNAAPKVGLSAPKVLPLTSKKSSAASVSELLTPFQSEENKITPSIAAQGKNSYIDFTNYATNPKQSVISSSSVILTERSTGCQIVSQNGQLLKGSCGSVAKPEFSKAKPASANHHVNLVSRQRKASSRVISYSRYASSVQPVHFKDHPLSPQQVVSLKPITRKRLSISLEPVPKYNRAASLYSRLNSNAPEQSQTDLMYPLPVVASITSAFGWRTHPISGTGRQHSGTDIGAPIGTSVLAAYDGEVFQSDWLGGYGLTVILRHLEGTQESRYAHLSKVYVQPGEWVNQGAVIGQVGSTGYSTGPHLHFEWRHLTDQGWVAVDAGLHLEYALTNLMRSMQMAKAVKTSEG
ncbi:M23 family metallopeptidase [cyanobacterium endosymbiont of Epithemia clementina EcSB]|uniref:M23 family metallopeptidase n=1 Tax=cyanobacterium endosymbiont of Epithemia clementina EcSB TaxID=3034674 RepID=UPI0024806A9C|nr:M23 family metallopeptidase [cyanobacterium endosymbiont of Epithemia clementina EcSB]WGT68130.1 M23 family metallopeptidase [cyanobacterium endosymbiont of Epithemia clementina EcSB]